jgi:hypothetical protein
MQKRLSNEPNLNVEEITGKSRHALFLIEEWHDVIGEVYVEFVTNGDPNEQASWFTYGILTFLRGFHPTILNLTVLL